MRRAPLTIKVKAALAGVALAGVALDLTVSYAARRPWVPSPHAFRQWAIMALAGSAPVAGLAPVGRKRKMLGENQCVDLSIRVVGARRSRRLNLHYRNKDRPTNILSFAGIGVLPNGRCSLGELVICAPVVDKEAKAAGLAARAHWAHMIVHGVLHLRGFDHEKALEARKMTQMEVQILDQLEFSDPYG